MLNLFKKDKSNDYKPVNGVVKSYYFNLLNEGINNNVSHKSGVSFPADLYEFLKLFAKFENIPTSKVVIDMILFILEDKNRFNQFLNEKYGKKL